MRVINLAIQDDQYFSGTFNNEFYRFRLLDRGTVGVFLDVYRNDELLSAGLACLDRTKIIRSAYKRFYGDLMFVDQKGFNDPQFTYYNLRFQLCYLSPDELSLGA